MGALAEVFRSRTLPLAVAVACLSIGQAEADDEADKAAIAARLKDFAAAFNARDAAGACSICAGPTARVTKEPGLDVFRRQPDGRWAISRFLAFSNAPD